MSDFGHTTVRCPWCLETLQVDPLNVITLTTSEEIKERLLAGEYDSFPCPVCNRQVPYSSAIVCNDITNQVLIYYFPNPPPEEVRDTLQDSLIKAIEKTAFNGMSTPIGEDWKVRIAYGRDELRAMLSGQVDQEGRQ
jgi:hypothetical protein